MGSFTAQPVDMRRPDDFIDGMRIGRIVDVDADGLLYVDYGGNSRGPLAAKMSASMQARLETAEWSAFTQVVLLFEEGDPARPVVIDMVVGALRTDHNNEEVRLPAQKEREVTIDGQSLVFDAREQIVLRCGKASITLTRAGKVIIRGAYLLARSSGVHRIKGGSVQIN